MRFYQVIQTPFYLPYLPIIQKIRIISKEKTPLLNGVFSYFLICNYKPNSVSDFRQTIIIYLGQKLLFGSSGTLSCDSTALHLSKDFAVSPQHFCWIIPCGTLCLQAQTSLLAPLSLRTTGVTRYPSPIAINVRQEVFGLSSPSKTQSNYPLQTCSFISQIDQKIK